DGGGRGAVEWLDDDQSRLGRGNQRELLELHLCAVVFDIDVFHEGGRGFAGSHSRKLVRHVVNRLLHRLLSSEHDFVWIHKVSVYSRVTSVPTFSPQTIRRMLCGVIMSKTMIGNLLS